MKIFKLSLVGLFMSLNSIGQTLSIDVELCDANPESVRMFGPWWSWDPNGGPVAESNGDGTWTFTFDPAPSADMEYLILADGEAEGLIGKGACAPVTDGATYANRMWYMTDGNNVSITYGQCEGCSTTGASELSNQTVKFDVFPNPTSDVINISTTQIFNRFSIVNILGSEVSSFIPNSNNSFIDLSELSPGIYYLNGFTKNNKYTQQVIVK